MLDVPGSVGVNPPDRRCGCHPLGFSRRGVPAEVRLYDRLFTVPRPDDVDGDFSRNQTAVAQSSEAMLEPSLAKAEPGSRWQLERLGYFVCDAKDSRPGAPVLNRIVTLRDSWTGSRRDCQAGDGCG